MSKTDDQDLNRQDEEYEVDLMELATNLWANRGKLLKWTLIGAVLGLLFAFSIPREYQTVAKLSPELSDSKKGSGGLSALASMAGINAGGGTTEAVYPQLYPDIVKSIPFLTGLFSVEVQTSEGERMTVEQYLQEDLRRPWWKWIAAIPRKVSGMFRAAEDVPADHQLNNFKLTRQETRMVETLSGRISATVEDFISISVTMQDPMVSAILCDTVVARLQQYVADYRTNKARQDLQYALKINAEAQQEYYNAQKKLADYTDRNQGIATQSARITRDRLENEAQLAFTLYNQTAQRVQTCKTVVQENTPVYVVVNPPTVPIKPSSPNKVLMLVGFAFLGFVLCAVWILFIKPFAKDLKKSNKKTNNQKNDEEA
ncbi:MAG: chain-length determining protein [Muribaculaceae bacterium]|nr:chain-length determining protein [Muribaculaceae bacterium]